MFKYYCEDLSDTFQPKYVNSQPEQPVLIGEDFSADMISAQSLKNALFLRLIQTSKLGLLHFFHSLSVNIKNMIQNKLITASTNKYHNRLYFTDDNQMDNGFCPN